MKLKDYLNEAEARFNCPECHAQPTMKEVKAEGGECPNCGVRVVGTKGKNLIVKREKV